MSKISASYQSDIGEIEDCITELKAVEVDRGERIMSRGAGEAAKAVARAWRIANKEEGYLRRKYQFTPGDEAKLLGAGQGLDIDTLAQMRRAVHLELRYRVDTHSSVVMEKAITTFLEGGNDAIVYLKTVASSVRTFEATYISLTGSNDTVGLETMHRHILALAHELQGKRDRSLLRKEIARLNETIGRLKLENGDLRRKLEAQPRMSFMRAFVESYATEVGKVSAIGTGAFATAAMFAVIPSVAGLLQMTSGPEHASSVQECLLTLAELAAITLEDETSFVIAPAKA